MHVMNWPAEEGLQPRTRQLNIGGMRFQTAVFLASLFSLIAGSARLHAVDTIVDEVKVPPYVLPDPLTFQDGSKVRNSADWQDKRRPELLRLFENEIYGKTLVGRPQAMRFVVREEIKDARGGAATRLRVGILFEGRETGRQMELLVYLPNNSRGRIPIFLGLNFDGNYTTTVEPDLPVPRHWANGLFVNRLKNNTPSEGGRGIHQHMWPFAYAMEHGYGIATIGYGEIEPDAHGHWKDGPRGLGPEPGAGDWGTIGSWAWGLSRALDYLESNPRVDARNVIVIGFSRLGKAALWAAAQDERFAAVVSNESGAGGIALSKRLFGERVDHLTHSLGHWFAPNFSKYSDNEEALPIDQHELAALIAPRPLLIMSGTTDLNSDPKGEFLGGLGASPVYKLLGTDGCSASDWPGPSALVDGTIGYFLRPGGHDVTLEDWQAMIAFADKHLAKAHR
ncbi:MAG: acetylxylan esterase [Verrucomicrobiales bacterium]|nr:acetylxylan esterase [Verrucomicrobiales bacterium]